MALNDYKFTRRKGQKLQRRSQTRSGRRVGVKAFVGRTAEGTFWARACIVGQQWHFKSGRRQLKAIANNQKRCSRDVTATTPRRAIGMALSSLGVNMRK